MKAIKIKVFGLDEVYAGAAGAGGGRWTYAFVEVRPGEIYLCEVYSDSYCIADGDILDEREFNEICEEEPDFYQGKSHAEYFRWALLDTMELVDAGEDSDAKES